MLTVHVNCISPCTNRNPESGTKSRRMTHPVLKNALNGYEFAPKDMKNAKAFFRLKPRLQSRTKGTSDGDHRSKILLMRINATMSNPKAIAAKTSTLYPVLLVPNIEARYSGEIVDIIIRTKMIKTKNKQARTKPFLISSIAKPPAIFIISTGGIIKSTDVNMF